MKPVTTRIALTIACLAIISIAYTACTSDSQHTQTPKSPESAEILLFDGVGTSPNDVVAVKSVLTNQKLSYATADSAQVNALSESHLRQYRLLIIPGGNFVKMGNSLSPVATVNIRNAVQNGLNYLGICAGAFLAGNSPFHGLNLTSGVHFPFYSAEAQGIRKAAVAVTSAGEAGSLDQYWEDGPQLTGWGQVVARYPDGTPAVAQGAFGNGWVVLSGVHPEAPENWRRNVDFKTPASVDNAYAATLVNAALRHEALPAYQ